MKKSISAWMLRRSSQTNCGPGIIALALLVVLAGLIAIYWTVVLETLEIIGLVLAGGLVAWLVVSITVQVRKYRAAHPRPVPATTAPLETVQDTPSEPVSASEPRTWGSLEHTAEYLADPEISLSFAEDGKTFQAHRTPSRES